MTKGNEEVPVGAMDVESPATFENAKTIKAINENSIHRICSGQVILTLATAAKELIENSLDAGATSIDICLKGYGGSLIEVNDNGHGVEPANYANLTLKHYTSKLENFGDLVELNTFGFRGEALSSLCALSSMCVTTRHKEESVGTKLLYNTDGKILEETAISRQIGTTVSISNIFSTLPVRYKEFHRNLKKEFAKFVQVLYAYCIISTNIRIHCSNQCEKGKKKVIASTEGYPNMRNNIISIFGSKQVSTLIELVDAKAEEDIDIEDENIDIFSIDGYISSCAHGNGRGAPDRQFYFINGRPCDPMKVSKLVNEIYHQYNKHQYPMVVLRISIKSGNVDVNVTPDKRQIMVSREKVLLSKLKNMLITTFQDIPCSYNVDNTSSSLLSSQSFNTNDFQSSQSQFSPSEKSSPSTNRNSSPNDRKISHLMKKFQYTPTRKRDDLSKNISDNLMNNESDYLSRNKSDNLDNDERDNLCKNEETLRIERLQSNDENSAKRGIDNDDDGFIERDAKSAKLLADSIKVEDLVKMPIDDIEVIDIDGKMETFDETITNGVSNKEKSNLSSGTTTPQMSRLLNKNSCSPRITSGTGVAPSKYLNEIHSKTDSFLNSLKQKFSSTPRSSLSKNKSSVYSNTTQINQSFEDIDENNVDNDEIQDDFLTQPVIEESETESNMIDEELTILRDDTPSVDYECTDNSSMKKNTFIKKKFTVSSSMDSIRQKLTVKKTKSSKIEGRRFLAKISPDDNDTAQEELKKEISKNMFNKMRIIGQFNLGFIIVCLNSDLFIIDQHASDEKYNFETLQTSFVLQKQKLLFPQKLELSVASESILISNLDIFHKNSFEFLIDETKPYGQRVSMTSFPYSKGWEFNKEDIDELIFMLSDADGVMCRPSRVRQMFASRACRKSVMIGTYLNTPSMKKLVKHMSEIDQPWNCPHGRPTMRHLVNIDVVARLGETDDSD